MLQQSHPEGRQTFNIFLTRWPETNLVVIYTIPSLLLFEGMQILLVTFDVPTVKFANAISDHVISIVHPVCTDTWFFK